MDRPLSCDFSVNFLRPAETINDFIFLSKVRVNSAVVHFSDQGINLLNEKNCVRR
jgi:hypothetical protein